jgi:hypothetical protein
MKKVAATRGQRVSLAVLVLALGRAGGWSWAGSDTVLNFLCLVLLGQVHGSTLRNALEHTRMRRILVFSRVAREKVLKREYSISTES